MPLPDGITLGPLKSLATAPLKGVWAHFQRQRQLSAAVQKAAQQATLVAPEHRDRFCRRVFRKRELLPRARRFAKMIDSEFDAAGLAARYLRQHPPSQEDEASAARYRATVLAMATQFARKLDARLLEAPAWNAKRVGHQVLRSAERLDRLVLDRPDLTWVELADAARAWHARTISSFSESHASFGQEVNPNEPGTSTKVPRPRLIEALRTSVFAPAMAPVVVVGEEGVGKTWAIAEALAASMADDEVILFVPSRAVGTADQIEDMLVAALASRFSRGTTRGWRDTLRKWFPELDGEERPSGRFVLVLDGVNQSQLIDLRRLYAEALGPRWRDALKVVVTVRPHNLPEATEALARHGIVAEPVQVGGYDDEELKVALALAGRPGLSHQESSPTLQALLRAPRYFGAAVRVWSSVVDLVEVTPNRLLLEDLRLRHGSGHSELTPEAWAGLLAHLGDRLLSAQKAPFKVGELREALQTTTLDPAKIEASLRDIRSGRLFEARGADRYSLVETHAALAIGMVAALHLADGEPKDLQEALDALDMLLPTLGADARSEALRAAVAIAYHWDLPGIGRLERAALLVGWLSSQNPTPNDDLEAAAYVHVDPVSYLDAYEFIATRVEPDRRVFWVLEPCLRTRASDAALQAAITQRAARWAGFVGLRETFLSADLDEESKARQRRFAETLGEHPLGAREVLGASVTFLPAWDIPFLLELTALVLKGAPLAPHAAVFRTAAIATAVGWPHAGLTKLRWVARLNQADPELADALFRSLAEELGREPPTGVPLHHVAQTAAYRLYDYVSEASDEAAMSALVGAETQQYRQVVAEYEADPANSLFTLHPADIEAVSARRDLKPFHAMRRLQSNLWDPTKSFHPSFAASVIEDARAHWKPQELSAITSSTSDDNYFELADLTLARTAPAELGRLRRAFVDEVATRAGRALDCGLWRTRDSLAAFSPTEFGALQSVLERHLGEMPNAADEWAQQRAYDLFDQIAVSLSGDEQLALVTHPRVGNMHVSAEIVVSPPSHEVATDVLLDAPERPSRLGGYVLLALSGFRPEGALRHQVEDDALLGDGAVSGAALLMLSTGASPQFVERLLMSDWSWASRDAWTGHYGSLILARFAIALPLARIIDRIAPWLLPLAVHLRGAHPDEIEAASTLLERALFRPAPPALGARVTVEVRSGEEPEALARTFIGLKAPSDRDGAFRFAIDAEMRRGELNEAVERASAAIEHARSAGATLLYRDVPATGLADFAPTFATFARRLLVDARALGDARYSAGGLLIRMCEILFVTHPDLAVGLWRALADLQDKQAFRDSSGTFLHLKVLFGAPASPERDALIAELWSIERTGDDEALFTIVHAGERAGAADVVDGLIAKDRASQRAFNQARAIQAESFRSDAPCDEALRHDRYRPNAWPLEVAKQGTLRAARNAAAKTWYGQFVSDPDPDRALAAWLLMLDVVDRRFFIWRDAVHAEVGAPSGQRLAHLALNWSDLEKAIKKADRDLEKTFLGEKL